MTLPFLSPAESQNERPLYKGPKIRLLLQCVWGGSLLRHAHRRRQAHLPQRLRGVVVMGEAVWGGARE